MSGACACLLGGPDFWGLAAVGLTFAKAHGAKPCAPSAPAECAADETGVWR